MTINSRNSVAPNFLNKGDIIEILAPAKFILEKTSALPSLF